MTDNPETGQVDFRKIVISDFIPYCPQCRWALTAERYEKLVRPLFFCPRCRVRGHNERLVANEEDRQWRVNLWQDIYDRQGRSEESRQLSTHWRNINRPMTAEEAAQP